VILSSGLVANPGPSWHIERAGNFHNDGHTDVRFQNDDGSVGLWDMNSAAISRSGVVGDPGRAWHVGTGDFNQDGTSGGAEILTGTEPRLAGEALFSRLGGGAWSRSSSPPMKRAQRSFSSVHPEVRSIVAVDVQARGAPQL
jgi:hypothetical protein